MYAANLLPDIWKKMFYRAVLYGGIQFSINFHAVSLAAEFLAVPIRRCFVVLV